MSMLTRLSVAFAVAALMFGCSDDSGNDGAPAAGAGGTAGGPSGNAGTAGSGAVAGEPAVTFTKDIHPILLAKCGTAGCHDGKQEPILPGHGSADIQHGYDATQKIGAMGQPVYERILARITSDDPSTIMPPVYASPSCEGAIGAPGCVTEAELALIQAWIDAGTPL